MAFTPKVWQNTPAGGTKLNADGLIDLETRLGAYADATSSISRIDLVGHSIAGGGGAIGANFEQGWVDKLTALFGARLRDASKGGSMVSMHEGGVMYTGGSQQNSGWGRTLTDFPMQDQIGPALPFLPMSQLAIIWHITNDVAFSGPNGMPHIMEGLRTEIARFLAAHVFEDSATTVQSGYTPVAYSGSTAWVATAQQYGMSNGDYHYQSVAYTGANNNKITIQVPADLYGGGIIQLGFLAGSSAQHNAIWEVHDVTSGDVLLATYNLTGLGNNAAGVGNGAIAAVRTMQGITRRLSLTAGPTTAINGEQWLPGGTLTVSDTSAFASSGVLRIRNALISYTGKTATTFTGCTLASGYGIRVPTGEPVYGSRNLELRPVTITSGLAIFDFWAIEAPSPGLVAVPLMYKPDSYAIWSTWPYSQVGGTLSAGVAAGASTLTLNTATVTNAMTAAGTIGAVTGGSAFWMQFQNVRIDNEIIYASGITPTSMPNSGRGSLGSTAATHAAGATVFPYVRAGDRITIGFGTANQETLLVQSVAGATITLTTPLANAHASGDRILAGYQDADIDAQNTAVTNLLAEFPSSVFAIPVDDLVNGTSQPPWSYFIGDGVHPNDQLHVKIAKRFYDYIVPKVTVDLAANASPADVGPWGGDWEWGMMTLNTHWSAYSANVAKATPSGTYAPRFKKDMASGLVTMEGAVVCDALANIGSVIFTFPQGVRPGYDITRVIPTLNGPAIVAIKATGDVQLVSGGSLTYTELAFSFLAEG